MNEQHDAHVDAFVDRQERLAMRNDRNRRSVFELVAVNGLVNGKIVNYYEPRLQPQETTIPF